MGGLWFYGPGARIGADIGGIVRVRILYPTVTETHGIKGPAGEIVDVEDELARALITEGSLEAVESPARVERATQAPGEKRPVGRPKKVTE